MGGLVELGAMSRGIERFEPNHLALERHARGRLGIVVVGHSHAAFGVDAELLERETGRGSYNFAILGTDLYVQARLVEEFVIPQIAPDVVVWHIAARILNGGRSNSEIALSDSLRMRSNRWLAGLAPLASRSCTSRSRRGFATISTSRWEGIACLGGAR